MSEIDNGKFGADAILGDLNEAQELKEEGGESVKEGKWRLACAKYMSALAHLDGYSIGSAGRMCPSENPEYQLLWTGLLEQHANLELSCHLNVSLCRLKSEEWAEAAEAASCALRLVPRHPKALFRRGVAQSRRSRCVEAGGAHWLEEAREDLTTAAKVEPQNKEIRVELQAVKDLLRAEKVREAAAKASEQQGDRDTPQIHKGEVTKKSSAFRISELKELYKDHADGPLERMCITMEEASELRANGKPTEALVKYKSAMKDALLGEADDSVKLTLQLGTGDCCMDLHNYERACATFEAAAEIAASIGDKQAEARAWCCMGVGLELRENVAAALHPYQNCLKAARACGDQALEQMALEGIEKASSPEAKAKSLEHIIAKVNGTKI